MNQKKGEKLTADKNLVHRLKKFVVSKLSASQTGRMLMRNALGHEGHEIMRILLDVCTRYSEPHVKDDIQSKFYNIVYKVNLLIDGNLISEDKMQKIKNVNAVFSNYFCKQLSLPPGERNSMSAGALLIDALAVWTETLTPHLKKKNIDKVEVIVKYCASGFLDFFMCNRLNQYACIKCQNYLESMLKYGGSLYVDQESVAKHMRARISKKAKNLRNALRRDASLDVLLQHKGTLLSFAKWLRNQESSVDAQLVNKLNFYQAYNNIKQNNSKHVVNYRAKELADRYFNHPTNDAYIEYIKDSNGRLEKCKDLFSLVSISGVDNTNDGTIQNLRAASHDTGSDYIQKSKEARAITEMDVIKQIYESVT